MTQGHLIPGQGFASTLRGPHGIHPQGSRPLWLSQLLRCRRHELAWRSKARSTFEVVYQKNYTRLVCIVRYVHGVVCHVLPAPSGVRPDHPPGRAAQLPREIWPRGPWRGACQHTYSFRRDVADSLQEFPFLYDLFERILLDSCHLSGPSARSGPPRRCDVLDLRGHGALPLVNMFVIVLGFDWRSIRSACSTDTSRIERPRLIRRTGATPRAPAGGGSREPAQPGEGAEDWRHPTAPYRESLTAFTLLLRPPHDAPGPPLRPPRCDNA